MVRNIVWGSTEIDSRAIAIQYFSLWFILLSGRYGYSKFITITSYNANLTQYLVINELEETSFILFSGFNSYMKVNSDNSHLLMSESKAIAKIDNNRIESEDINEL